MTTTPERIDALGRARKRLSFMLRHRPFYKQTIKDTRVIIEALESLILLDLKKGEISK